MAWDDEPPKTEELQAPAWDAAPPPAAANPQGILGAVGAAMGATPELQPYGKAEMPQGPASASMKDAAMGGFNAARETLASPMRTGQTLMGAPDVVGEGTTEALGEAGVPGAVAGSIGGAIQMAPYAVGAAQGLKGLYNSGNKYAMGITKTPQEIGKLMEPGEEAAGVTSHLPELRGSKPTFPPPELNYPVKQPATVLGGAAEIVPEVTPKSYPSDKNTFLNMADDRMKKFGNKLSAQEVTDYHRQIKDWFDRGKILKSTPIGAIATQAKQNAASIRGQVIPGRAALDEAYGVSKTLHPQIMKALKNHFAENAGKYVLGGAAAGLGIGAIRH